MEWFFFQIVGMPYLLDTLKPVIDKIFEERKYCELDPSKAERKSSPFRWVTKWRLDAKWCFFYWKILILLINAELTFILECVDGIDW